MNAGFASLVYLKAQLLAEALRDGTRYDAALTLIGQGVAAQFASHCNRPLSRAVGHTEILAADAAQFLLERYPVEAITAIDLKSTEAEGWVSQTINDLVLTIDLKNGIVSCPNGADVGPYYAQLRFTYTGGYWFDTTDDQSDTLPTGATALPEDIRLAWVLQCREIWNKMDKTGVGIAAGMGDQIKIPQLSELKLLPQVVDILGEYIRYNFT